MSMCPINVSHPRARQSFGLLCRSIDPNLCCNSSLRRIGNCEELIVMVLNSLPLIVLAPASKMMCLAVSSHCQHKRQVLQ